MVFLQQRPAGRTFQTGSRGSILLELILSVVLLWVVIVFQIELVRRASYEALFHLFCFRVVREQGLGAGSTSSYRWAFKAVKMALPPGEVRRIQRTMEHFVYLDSENDLVAKAHYRFSALMRFPSKHHYELTKKCKFYF